MAAAAIYSFAINSGGFGDADIARHWINVHDKLVRGEMPPAKRERPGKQELQEVGSCDFGFAFSTFKTLLKIHFPLVYWHPCVSRAFNTCLSSLLCRGHRCFKNLHVLYDAAIDSWLGSWICDATD